MQLQPPFKVWVNNISKDAGVSDRNGSVCVTVADTWSDRLAIARKIAAGLRLVVTGPKKKVTTKKRKSRDR